MVDNPLKDREGFYSEIREATNDYLDSRDLSHPPNFLYNWILGYVLENYAVFPKHISADSSQAYRFSEIISQWANVNTSTGEVDIPVDSILHHLASEGWIIIPPK